MRYFLFSLIFIFSAFFHFWIENRIDIKINNQLKNNLQENNLSFFFICSLTCFFFLFIFLIFFFFQKSREHKKIFFKKYFFTFFFSLFIFIFFQWNQQNQYQSINNFPLNNFQEKKVSQKATNRVTNKNEKVQKKNYALLEVKKIKGFGKKYFEIKTKLLSLSSFYEHKNEKKINLSKNKILKESFTNIKNQNLFFLLRSRLMITNLQIGDVIEIKNKKIFWSQNITNKIYASYLWRQNIVATVYCIPSDISNRKKIFSLENFLEQKQDILQEKIEKKIFDFIPYPAATLSFAMITGKKQKIPTEVLQDFRATGTYHMLAVSGLHAGIIALLFFSFFRFFLLRRDTILLLLLFLFFPFYLFIVDSPISIIRTYLMACFAFLIKKMDKNFEYSNIWAITFLSVLFVSPEQIKNISFQLSFSAVLGIFLTLEIIKNFQIKSRPIQYLLVSLSAQCFTAPILIYYFGYFNFLTLFYNLFISFLIFLSLLLSLLFLFSPLQFFSSFLAESITFINHSIFFILKKTSYQSDFFYIDKKQNLYFAVFLGLIIFSLTWGIKLYSNRKIYNRLVRNKKLKHL